VNTLVLYDVPRRAGRQRLETLPSRGRLRLAVSLRAMVIRAPVGTQRINPRRASAAEPEARRRDPEQLLISSILDDGNRMIFEFRRAHILSVSRRADLETRLVAMDSPSAGLSGRKTIYRFDTRLLALASRCVEHLSGAIDLFPARERSLAHKLKSQLAKQIFRSRREEFRSREP